MKIKHLPLLVGGLLMPVQMSLGQAVAEVAEAVEVKPAKVAEFADLTVEAVQAELKKGGVTMIDVNPEKSYKAGHIPGALHFSAIKGDAMAAALPTDKAALIVAYCGGPTWSAWKEAAVAAKKLGYTNVKCMSAGISGWKTAGAETAAVSME